MLLDLTDNFNLPGKEMHVSYVPEIEERAGFQKDRTKPVEFDFVTVKKGRIRFTAEGELLFTAECDRCLTPVEVPIRISSERELSSPDSEPEGEEDESRDFMDGHSLDAEAFLEDEISLGWPMKILCREDCKGLCPVCGADRNKTECGCDTFVPDVRMAGIKDIFEQSQK